jgi:hypothetical protein
MGATGAVAQALLLPSPWRERITWVSLRGGRPPGTVSRAVETGSNRSWPDRATDPEFWNKLDIPRRLAVDPVLQSMHFRGAVSLGAKGAKGWLALVNALERHRVGGAFAWVAGDDNGYERRVRLPDLSLFEVPAQDVSLDRPHPAFTNSTGNHPATPGERQDVKRFPRGHYNLGILWDHEGIIDEAGSLVFPLAYQAHSDIGGGLPDQPTLIEVDVTPRRMRNFNVRDGETLKWDWDSGALHGTVVVNRGTFTIAGLPLVSGVGFRPLRIYR